MIEFITDLGSTVMVGRNASENESLTMEEAKGSDMFFHASEFPGAHVILKSREGIPFKPREIAFAADIAASFSSEGGDSAKVQLKVSYCLVWDIVKEKYSKKGEVTAKHWMEIMGFIKEKDSFYLVRRQPVTSRVSQEYLGVKKL